MADAAPWTIKAVPIATREKAIRCARMSGETMAEWLTKAVDTEASKQGGNLVIPPGKPEPTQRNLEVPDIGLGDVTAALHAMTAAASVGLPVSKPAVRDTVALIRVHVRVARGLPARQTRRPNGQTINSEQEEMKLIAPTTIA